ncbi:MAG: glucose-1-phosphate adenylyltransferase [Anaerovoracaceae bacterium]
MINKKKCIAMLLAGGQGSRLYSLTTDVAKPAVPFGGKYRIIDFPLSNCVNSDIDTVGVLTQYQPLELNEYIGNGAPWDLDRSYGGAYILPPYQRSGGADWYKGTANAIFQNIKFIEKYNPDYVLILSGDHIYKMDYNKMLKCHIKSGAAATIAVLDVSLEEASRFGIMNTNADGSVYEFEEKPENPKSTRASMGIYIFSTETLKEHLQRDEENPNSTNDFGKDVIPQMLAAGEKLMTYDFEGYWKDVGTLDSLWEANMDLLGKTPKLDLRNPLWRIYYRHYPQIPQYIAEGGSVKNSIVAEGCEIYGEVENSVLFSGVTVEKGQVIKDSVVMSDGKILTKNGVEVA